MSDRNDQSPDDIERHIEETQDSLRRDMDELEERMSPEGMAHEAGDRVRETVTEGARQAGDAMREQLDRTFDRLDERNDWASWGLVGTVALIGLGFILMRAAAQREEMDMGAPEGGFAYRSRTEAGRTGTEDRGDVPEVPPHPSPMEG